MLTVKNQSKVLKHQLLRAYPATLTKVATTCHFLSTFNCWISGESAFHSPGPFLPLNRTIRSRYRIDWKTVRAVMA